MKKLLKKSLFLILPISFFMILYLLAGFYYMDLNANNWTESARLLIALEGFVFIITGIVIAFIENND